MPDIRLSRSDDGQFIWLNRNGVTSTFQMKDWLEFVHMCNDFNTTNAKRMQNYEELPTRTPLHANVPKTPTKSTLDDLI